MSDDAFVWRGKELSNFRHLIDALDACTTVEELAEFRVAYRQFSQEADEYLRDATGHLDPWRGAELRGWLWREKWRARIAVLKMSLSSVLLDRPSAWLGRRSMAETDCSQEPNPPSSSSS